MNEKNKNVITTKNLSKHFGRAQPVRAVNFTAQAGEFITLLGPSGSGKSTLLGLVAGLEKPSQGSIRLLGKEITGLNEDQLALFRREHVGFIFQAFHLIPTLNSLENVAFPLYPVHMTEQERTDRALALLEKVGLKDRATHPPAQLSGGERQRVAIARALVNEPSILFCDEPTGNLDSASGGEILDLLMQLNRNRKLTIFMVTHDKEIAQLSHRSLYMHDGEVTVS